MNNLRGKVVGAFRWLLKLSLVKKILIAVIVIGFLYILFFTGGKKTQAPQITTATVEKGTIISSLSQTGSVTSTSITNVGSPTNGVITEIYVKNGENVYQGQNLFKVKSTATPQEQAQAYASYLSSLNSLNSAKAKLNGLQSTLFKANQAFVNGRGVDNPTNDQKNDPVYIEQNADWLQAEADYKNQQGVIAAAQASFNNASLTYASTQDSIVTAPVEGTVANFSLGIGSNVTASGTTYNNSNTSNQSSSGTPVLILGNFTNLSIKTPVSEVDVSKIKSGQKATITLDAYPDKTYVGVVSSIDTVGTNSSGVVTFNAYVDFVSPPSTIQPGMSATATIQLAKKDNVIVVPLTSVTTDVTGSYVKVMKNGKPVETQVVTGIFSDDSVEILSGLNVGDTIITSEITQTTSGSAGSSPFGSTRSFGGFGAGGGNVRFISR